MAFTFAAITGDAGGSTHEPITLPGGYIFVPASLILTAQSEAEFAGMLAHAVAHVVERHDTRQATRGQLMNTSSAPLYMDRWTGYAVQQGAALSIPLGFLSLQRAFELQADQLAIRITAGAGYDPEALVRYISRVQTEDDPARSQAFSPLPARDKRIAGMQQALQQLPARGYTLSEEFQPIQDEVRRLTAKPPSPPPTLLGR